MLFDPNVQLHQLDDIDYGGLDTNFPYTQIISNVMFAMLGSCLDITYVVYMYNCQVFICPHEQIHCIIVKHIFKYVYGTTISSLNYSGEQSPNMLVVYSYVNFVGDIDDCKSKSGCIVFLNQGPICWINKKQSYIASSTIESKYIVTCVIVKETIWFHCLLNDIGYFQEGPTPFYCNNQFATQLVINPEFLKHTKHIDISISYAT